MQSHLQNCMDEAPATGNPLSAYAKPPADLKVLYKRYQKTSVADIQQDASLLVDAESPASGWTPTTEGRRALRMPDGTDTLLRASDQIEHTPLATEFPACYDYPDLPGLYVYPDLFPPHLQIQTLDGLLHRDIANPAHKNNLNLHYNIEGAKDESGCPLSFFDPVNDALVLQPHDPSLHTPLSIQQVLDKKLRWTTLGGQYDWTAKRYPDTAPPPFPKDLAILLSALFPTIIPDAAILNLYSPGHTLSLHRDVSEQCAAPLVSVSFGCECVFVVGLGGGAAKAMRLRSGDVMVMSGEARWAWHGVPKILAGTCPEWLARWPVIEGNEDTYKYEAYKGWMAGKRINLNVRQMSERSHT